MRYLISLLCVVSLAGASGTLTGHTGGSGGGFHFPETDFLLDSYAYNPSQVMSTLGASFGDYAEVDDFDYQYGSQFWLEYYVCWGVTTGSAPVEMDLLYVEDNGGAPYGPPITQTTYSADCLNSGYTFAGYTIWIAELYLLDNPWFDSPCWLGAQRNDSGNWYPVGGTAVTGSEAYRTTGSGWAWQPFSSSLEQADLFKIFGNYGLQLQRDTWAGIKNSF